MSRGRLRISSRLSVAVSPFSPGVKAERKIIPIFKEVTGVIHDANYIRLHHRLGGSLQQVASPLDVARGGCSGVFGDRRCLLLKSKRFLKLKDTNMPDAEEFDQVLRLEADVS